MLYKFCMLCQYHCHVTQAGILLWCVIVLCIMYDKNLKLKVCANFFAAFLSIFSAIFVSKYFHYDSLSSKLRLCFNCDIVCTESSEVLFASSPGLFRECTLYTV